MIKVGYTDTRVGIDGTAVDIQVVFRQHLGALVDGSTRPIEDPAQHVLGHAQFETVPRKLDFGLSSRLSMVLGLEMGLNYLLDIDACSTLKHLRRLGPGFKIKAYI